MGGGGGGQAMGVRLCERTRKGSNRKVEDRGRAEWIKGGGGGAGRSGPGQP